MTRQTAYDSRRLREDSDVTIHLCGKYARPRASFAVHYKSFHCMAAPFFEAERKWIDLLKCSGIDYFKFSESQALVGQFDPARLMMDSNSARVFAERVSVRLSKVLGDHKVKSLGLSMDVRVFGDFVEKDKGNRAHSPVSDAYIEMFKQFMIGCMSRVDGSAHTVAAMTVSFVLDGGK